ncbi:MAG: CBS domain-containing protein [Chromatiales bacterium]|nr:CBS domain-containing protein [Chromatiales bacterium]
MKISASIYSSSSDDLAAIVRDLDAHGADLFHIDCNDNPAVFDDIATIRSVSTTPIDLHIISPTPSRYYGLIAEHAIEYVSFQYEGLTEALDVPEKIRSRLGLAITSATDNSAFAPFAERFDFVLIMCTTPGVSGGTFDKENFRKIRQFRKQFPRTRVHVDGGVNHEVSFILRNMGVDASVSGSYLMNSNSVGAAMLNLKTHEVDSHFLVRDFMRELEETPLLSQGDADFHAVLTSIEQHNLGFTLLVDEQQRLLGMITNADIRRGLLKHRDDFNAVTVDDITNTTPLVIDQSATVTEMLQLIKRQTFAVNYLPVVDEQRKVTGSLTFMNLIKGEL